MNLSNMTSGTLGDKETLTDLISSQKYASSTYNTYAGECVNTQLRDDFLCILKDEHEIQSELFKEANTRGWYTVKPAEMNEITQVRQKFTGQ